MNDEPSNEMIYRAYPRKVGRFAALQAIERAVKKSQQLLGPHVRRLIYEAVCVFAESPAGNKGHFTPHCATWMNQGRFLDDPKEWNEGDENWRRKPSEGYGIYKPKPDDVVSDGNGGWITHAEWESRRPN